MREHPWGAADLNGQDDMTQRTCTFPGCGDPHEARGYCNKHYLRLRIRGDVCHERTPENAPRKYTLRANFFAEVSTEVQAYWLGFVTADGGVTQTARTNTLRVGLNVQDTDHLIRMNMDMGSNRPLLNAPRNNAVVASFDSLRLINDLQSLGVGPRKSVTVKPWRGPDHLMPHYWRGMFDGDGSILRSNDDWVISMCGSIFCVEAFAEWACGLCGSRASMRHLKGGCWGWKVQGNRSPQILAAAMYENASVSLARKQALADALIAASFPGKGHPRV